MKPITQIIIQTLKSEIFPDKMKIAEDIPLYEKMTHLYWGTVNPYISFIYDFKTV